MKKKLIEFIGRLQDGGAETLVKDYALLLDKDKFDVIVLCEDYVKDSNVYKTLIDSNIKVVSMYEKSFFINKVLARIFGKKYVAKLFEKEIEKIKPDIIHAHLELLEVLYYARDYLKGVKLLFTCHNLPKMLIGDDRPKERDACRYLLDNYNLQIIALHQEMADEINEMFNIDNTKVIRNAIDFNKFRNITKTKTEIRNELGIGENSYVVGQVGRFAYQKNPEFTINVFKRLLDRKPDAYLMLVGRGNKLKAIKKQIKELNIEDKVLIKVGADNVEELLKAMDVFIMPSRYEGLGIVLIEAQVSGLPCVVSDKVPQEVYQSKNITCLSLNDDIDLWVDALLNRKGNIKKYGNLEDYDMNKEIKHLEQLYLDV